MEMVSLSSFTTNLLRELFSCQRVLLPICWGRPDGLNWVERLVEDIWYNKKRLLECKFYLALKRPSGSKDKRFNLNNSFSNRNSYSTKLRLKWRSCWHLDRPERVFFPFREQLCRQMRRLLWLHCKALDLYVVSGLDTGTLMGNLRL